MRAMLWRRSIPILVLQALLVGSAIVSCGAGDPPYEVVVSSAGTGWKMLLREPFETDDGRKAIRFRYQTDLSLKDKPALLAEVTQFMKEHRVLLRRGKFDIAIIAANTPIKSGWAMTRDERRYQFDRDETRWVISDVQRVNDVADGQRVEVH
jgi:hypothetical protein